MYLIITASIENRFTSINSNRKQEYTDAITETLLHLPAEIQPIIVENNGESTIFLDEFKHNNETVPVLYTYNNMRSINNKGMIELLDIKAVIDYYNIKDTDMIIKLSGRYTVKSPRFFNEVLKGNADAFIKFFNVCTRVFDSNDSVLGLYAVQCHLLRYWSHLTMNYNNPEMAFAHHIRRNTQNICEIQFLDLECNFANDGTRLRV